MFVTKKVTFYNNIASNKSSSMKLIKLSQLYTVGYDTIEQLIAFHIPHRYSSIVIDCVKQKCLFNDLSKKY